MQKFKRRISIIAGLVAITAIVAACASSAFGGDGKNRASSGNFLSTVSWDAEYDVVVIGFGGAGAASAVSAADAGAKVLVLEKAPEGEEGGNTRYAAQLVLIPKEKERAAAITYYKGLRGLYNNQSDDEINFIVDGSIENLPWFEKMGVDISKLAVFPLVEYPEIKGGNESIELRFIDGIIWQATFWKFLRKLVYDRQDNIDVWYKSPAVQLIQDKDSKTIHGVVAEHDGRRYNIRAKNGVVMALGGFENNDEMLENYAQLADARAKGARYNTGDGIKMAIDVGADLWHMSALSGPDLNFINPETGNGMHYLFTTTNTALYGGFGASNMILVGGNGKRFVDETELGRHGHNEVGGTYFSQLVPKNAYCVFDETARKTGTVYKVWSPGMEEEIAKGWIIKANSIQELAGKINIDPAALAAEITKYNGYCRSGRDPDFGVEAANLKPLETGPYYAFEVKATLTNTQGGAKRNVECEVLDVWGKPIPHLYSAGEFGSFFTDIYNGGGNLSECLFTGRTAGKNAATVKKDVPAGSVLNKSGVDFRLAPLKVTLGPNEYLGTGSGMGSDLVLKVRMDGSKIAAIEYISVHETPGLSTRAIVNIPQAIIKAQSTNVDIVTGATATSKAIIQAVSDALSKAK
ncbi:FAD-binding dehydrogenase [Spirochaetia bacterium]|nr:FAD-binding dehydrogenase [Spirochaetia bacterium]